MHPQSILTIREESNELNELQYSNEREGTSIDYIDESLAEGIIKDEFPDDHDSYNMSMENDLPIRNSLFSDQIPRKRRRIQEEPQMNQPNQAFSPPANEKEFLELELLRAKIDLAKTKKIAEDKSIQANTAMIMVMDRLMSRIEEKKDEADQSVMTNLIAIMKDMVKK
ncbi:hypothetical protein PFISCL1PPCAC_14620 [Pristionchus fissidentatus]|uniref:Uncharacterized protein n=1 Tax=Pristionchus fissidentatus TaxID=1538716 RepID=A0AAV5VYL4_9BILA|nr:hypothetical protein PFISCL1PPCAC_14620 [Pristionchus fissidentatus]